MSVKNTITKTLEVKDVGRQKMEVNAAVNIQQALGKLMDYIVENSDILIPFIVISALVTFVTYQIYAAINEQDPMNNLTKYIYLTAIPLVIIFAYIVYLTFDNKSKVMFYQFCIFGLIVFFIIYAIVLLSNLKLNLTIQNLFSYSFIGLIILFGLSIFYNIFANQFRTTDTWSSFWIEMIFYIPCMIEKFIKFMIKDYANTSNITLILFFIEIILIIFYFYFYPIYKESIYKDGIIVLKEPVYLNHVVSRLVQPLKDVDADRMQPPDDSNNPLIILFKPNALTYSYRANYAISMWIYVNPMPMTRIGYYTETNIFSYGTPRSITPIPTQTEYHPKLSLSQEDDNYIFNFYYSRSAPTHQLELPLQKWNNVVFNYIGNVVDVFINGELTLSYNFSDDLPKYSDDDDIYVGDTNGITNTNANGVYGSVCNIVYYKRPLTKREIILNYNMLVVNNPPLFL